MLREYSTDRLQQLRLQLPQLIYHDLTFAILKASIVRQAIGLVRALAKLDNIRKSLLRNHDLVGMRFT